MIDLVGEVSEIKAKRKALAQQNEVFENFGHV